MKRIAASIRHHWLFFFIVPLLIIIMTWPAARFTVDASALWTPSNDLDLGMKFWDAFYGGKILAGEAQLYFTDFLFYPKGLSLVYHNYSLPHMLLLLAAQLFLPATKAYNLCFMLIIFANAAASYVYLLYLFRDRRLATFGSVIFGLSVFVIEHPVHSDLNIVVALPLVMYCMERGLEERRYRWMVLAGLLTGFTAFTGLYIFVCLLITVGVYTIYRLPALWRTRAFWVSMLLLLAVAGSISSLRVYPMLRESAQLEEALNKGGGREHGSDLLDSFVHRENVISEHVFANLLRRPVPPVREDGYLGYVTLFLAAIGLFMSKPRRGALFWFALFLIFLLLKLGPALTVNGHTYTDILLPKHYLNILFPTVFKAFWITAYFHVGILLPLTILAALGLKRLLSGFPAKTGAFFVLACLALNLLETIEPPDSYIVPEQQLRHIDWLRSEERQDAIRLIKLPFGRGPSKRYAFFQSIHGYPQAEGLAARTPSAAYEYISGNLLLDAWRNERGILCLPFNQGAFQHALNQLLADGFSHIVFYNDVIRKIRFANYSVISLEPAYEDSFARVYRLPALRGACQESALLRSTVWSQLASMMSPSNITSQSEASSAGSPPLALALAADGMALGEPVSLAKDADPDLLLPPEGIVLLVYYRDRPGGDQAARSAAQLLGRYKSCASQGSKDAAYIEYFSRPQIPCDLLFGDEPLAVSYDNGVVLANASLRIDGDALSTALLWNTLPTVSHGASIQLFDAAGEKSAGGDFTIRHHSLSTHRLDLSTLEPGEYSVKLILYNFETRASVGGALISGGSRVERALEIGVITVD